jgi:hypothetical protein
MLTINELLEFEFIDKALFKHLSITLLKKNWTLKDIILVNEAIEFIRTEPKK